jgi:DNA polymerase III subunit alpha
MIPLFKSHYSVGRSILNLSSADETSISDSSILLISKKAGLKDVFLVDDSMSGFLEAYMNCEELELNLIFGLRITLCSDISQKNEESRSSNSKITIFCKSTGGYQRLVKIFGEGAKDGFYYEPRVDVSILKKHWSNEDLMICVPFYDSFLFSNFLNGGRYVPDFSFCKPTFFVEDNELPFDGILKDKVDSYCKDTYEMQRVKSIFYNKREDFISYLTFKCINKRTTLNKPNLDHMCSEEFCFESWQEAV